jgi:hypothetical protein
MMNLSNLKANLSARWRWRLANVVGFIFALNQLLTGFDYVTDTHTSLILF